MRGVKEAESMKPKLKVELITRRKEREAVIKPPLSVVLLWAFTDKQDSLGEGG